MAVGWIDKEAGFNKLLKNLQALEAKNIDVGFFDTVHECGINVAQIAQWQEEEGVAPHIPARPFIRVGFHSEVMSPRYKKAFNQLLDNVASGVESPTVACNRIGKRLETVMTLAIDDGARYTPNEKTWADRKARETGSTTPLIYTGTMRNSVKYKITTRR